MGQVLRYSAKSRSVPPNLVILRAVEWQNRLAKLPPYADSCGANAMTSIARVDSLVTEIANAFQYHGALAREVARSNLITFYYERIEEAAIAAEKALSVSDRILIGTIVRALRIID